MIRVALVLVVALSAAGCFRKWPTAPVVQDTYTVREGVLVNMHLPRRIYDFGDCFAVVVTARNLTDEPIRIEPVGEAQVHVEITSKIPPPRLREGPPGQPWTLGPREIRTWTVPLTVGREWRMDETYIRTRVSGLLDSDNVMAIWINPAGTGEAP